MPEEQIFISYAHIDNEPLTADEEGWVTTLHRMLEVRLAQLLGERPKIWRDPQMAGNAPITDTLTERLGHSTYLIPIISPRYVKSEWCCRELETFYSRYREPRRIFKVVKTGIPHEQHPAPVRDSLSYVFFRVDPDSGRLREFRPRSPSTAEDFVAQLDDLAFDLYRQISEMSQPATGSQAGEEGRLTVYLAHTTYALQQQRDEIRRELLEHGYRVLPDCDLPLTRDELVAKVEDALDQCDLAIHLIGGAYGLVPEGSQSSVLELQEQLSAARTTGEFSRILYVPKECETDDDRQRRFLWRVEEDPVSQRRTEFLRSSLDELYQVIHEKLQELAARRAAPEEVEGGNDSEVEASAARPAQIYILCDAEDLQAVEQLDQYLYDQDLEPVLPLFDGSPEELQEDHLRNLRSCDAVLLYQGAAREAWLRKARHEVENAAEFGRKRPFRAAALYVGPPHDPRKARVRSHSMTVIQAMDELNVEALDAFVQELKS
ncbi:MAG TPA: TIR domain-containing protein [Thermoanaerobaculia bacterium]|nr:TIR domain-containing protein [Thermoanaerobaculia bacterium]